MTSLELAKEHYFFEQQRKQELESAMNLPITVLTILTGAVALLLQEAYLPPRPLTSILVILLAIAIIGIVAGFAFTIKTFWRYYYSEVRFAEQLNHRESLKAYFTATGKPEVADAEFERDLAQRYGEAIGQNARVNQTRALWLYRAKFALSISATAVLLGAIPFAILKASEPPKQKECTVSNDPNTPPPSPNPGAPAPQSTPQATPSAPATPPTTTPEPAPVLARPVSPVNIRVLTGLGPKETKVVGPNDSGGKLPDP